jgi:peptidyl-prolyl cis-trans isomerase SurA
MIPAQNSRLPRLKTELLQLMFTIFALDLTLARAGEPVILDQLDGYVNTQPILQSDVEKYLKTLRLRSQIDPLYAHSAFAKKGKAAAQGEIIAAIINDRLIEKEFPKTDSDVEQEINTIQTTNHIDRKTLKEAIEREGHSFSDYFDLIRESTSKKELIGREIQTKVSVSEDDVKNYYLNHLPKETLSHRAFHIELIAISPRNYKSASAAIKIAQESFKQIRAGEPFEEVAKRVSDDATASNGGDLGFLNDDLVNPVIKKAIKDLQIGQVSEIFTDSAGRHLILKLVNIRSTETEQFDKMKDEIRAQLMAKEYEQQVHLWVERKRDAAVIHIQK